MLWRVLLRRGVEQRDRCGVPRWDLLRARVGGARAVPAWDLRLGLRPDDLELQRAVHGRSLLRCGHHHAAALHDWRLLVPAEQREQQRNALLAGILRHGSGGGGVLERAVWWPVHVQQRLVLPCCRHYSWRRPVSGGEHVCRRNCAARRLHHCRLLVPSWDRCVRVALYVCARLWLKMIP